MRAQRLELQRIDQPRGDLAIGELGAGLPFAPQRFFIGYDIPRGEERGGHAHRRLEQLLVCVAGVVIGATLQRPAEGVHLLERPWRCALYPADGLGRAGVFAGGAAPGPRLGALRGGGLHSRRAEFERLIGARLAARHDPYLDVGATYRELEAAARRRRAASCESGRYILGPELEAFERDSPNIAARGICVGVGNGLDALRLMLEAWNVGAGARSSSRAIPISRPGSPSASAARSRSRSSPTRRSITSIRSASSGDHAAHARDPRGASLRPAGRHDGAAAIAADRRGSGCSRTRRRRTAPACRRGARRSATLPRSVSIRARISALTATAARSSRITNSSPPDPPAAQLRRAGQKYVNDELGINSRLDELQAALLRVRLQSLEAWNARRQRDRRALPRRARRPRARAAELAGSRRRLARFPAALQAARAPRAPRAAASNAGALPDPAASAAGLCASAL
jgi:hypothetical protein